MEKPKNMTPQELREWHGQFATPLEIGIRERWRAWLEAARAIDNRIDWGDFLTAVLYRLLIPTA